MEYREFLKMKRGKKTRKKFADELGLTGDHYSKVERGQVKPSFTWLENVAKQLDAEVVVELVEKSKEENGQ
ncbi:helix-turn-helix domain-containing protein [Enterococcus faecalis]|uniref:helix-turn-helix domain-containing protein n=1 Tax=Enterococcus faecalis TaxID=1351 RepID=UPI001AF6DDA0|nr:helix-turn-helix transcriptional regulator [Enterococcus faecalis]QST21490.1 helix-turn-helix transcriptional regulator [Enterococcus faecalis]